MGTRYIAVRKEVGASSGTRRREGGVAGYVPYQVSSGWARDDGINHVACWQRGRSRQAYRLFL